MKVKKLTKKIFYESSQMTDNDKLESFIDCYATVQKKDIPECMKKWEQIYQFYGSSSMYQGYEANL